MSYDVDQIIRRTSGPLQVVLKSPLQGTQQDMTYLRDVPVVIEEFSNADPFGDATLVIHFPQISPFERVGPTSTKPDTKIINRWSEVSLYRVYSEAEAISEGTDKKLLFRGLLASLDMSNDGLRVSCVGAMYQLDYYVKRPYYYEDIQLTAQMILDEFGGFERILMRVTKGVNVYPNTQANIDQLFNKDVSPFKTRNHGAWEPVLTGYIQDQLATMVDPVSNKQWTLTHTESRRAPLFVLRGESPVVWTVDTGAPGVEVELSQDMTQVLNVIYGEGTDEARNTWRNAIESQDGSFTDYSPLASTNIDTSPFPGEVRNEAFYNFGTNFGLDDAISASEKFIERDQYVTWTGTITLRSDPHEGWRTDIRAGDRIKLNYFQGRVDPVGGDGTLSLHIASMSCSLDGDTYSVTLTVDENDRDLLTLEEAMARNRDSKTPSRLLQVGRESTTFNDEEVPWDYDLGSGFVPTASKNFSRSSSRFPYTNETTVTTPTTDSNFYVYVNGANSNYTSRWKFVRVLLSEQGSIRYTEFAMYDGSGSVISQPFHVSIYPGNYVAPDPGSWTQMPQDDDGNPTPFVTDAFREVDGVPVARHGHPELIIGWGDGDQKAGFWPGLESEGDPATGKLVDEATWQYSLDRGHKYVTVALYAEVNCYIMGRMVKADTTPERPILVGDG